MMQFFKERFAPTRKTAQPASLGKLEFDLMQILWSRGESNVRDVANHLNRSLAYTTVMTTLDRLFKKGFLDRRMPERAFLYSPCISRADWERSRAHSILAEFLTGPGSSRELLLSSFLEAVSERDALLLDELEKKIQNKRRELSRGGRR